jgi:hypothetical protein
MVDSNLLLHVIGLLSGLVALFVILLDLNVIHRANWNIFTARVFLKKEAYQETIQKAEYLLMIAVGSATTGHILSLVDDLSILAEALRILAIISLLGALVLIYRIRKEIKVPSD